MELSLYREVQRQKQLWIWGLIVILAIFAWYGFVQQIILGVPLGTNPAPDAAMWIIWLLVGIGIPWLLYSTKLVVEVRKDDIYIRYFPFTSRISPFKDLRNYEVRHYRPIKEYGGWGIRWAPGKGMAYTIGGNRGGHLELLSGQRVLVGSRNPEQLAQMIGQALGKAAN